MDLKNIGLFQRIDQQMRWLGRRQEVLAHNIANANTPGYQALDLAPPDLSGVDGNLATTRLATTAHGHIQPAAAANEAAKTHPVVAWEISPDGNSVVLEQQMVETASTQADYQLATELYRKHVGMLKAAIGVGNR